jgi:hypothetical protein
MHASVNTALARVVNVFSAAGAQHAYLLLNKRETLEPNEWLAQDGFRLWPRERSV